MRTGENEAIILKTIFDKERPVHHKEQNILHLNKPEDVRLQLTLDLLKVEDVENAFITDKDGLARVTIKSDEGWKCIPGRLLIDPIYGNVYRILKSTTYCSYEDHFNKLGERCTYHDLVRNELANAVEEEFLLETNNMPLIYVAPENEDWIPFLDCLSRLGFFYYTIDLALAKNMNFSDEVRRQVGLYENVGGSVSAYAESANKRVKCVDISFKELPLRYTEVTSCVRKKEELLKERQPSLKALAQSISPAGLDLSEVFDEYEER